MLLHENSVLLGVIQEKALFCGAENFGLLNMDKLEHLKRLKLFTTSWLEHVD